MTPENPESVDPNLCPGYWRGKTPCWVMLGCSKYVYKRCAAYLHPEIPCWEHQVTCCEEVLGIPKDCPRCIVYKVNHYQETTDTAAFY